MPASINPTSPIPPAASLPCSCPKTRTRSLYACVIGCAGFPATLDLRGQKDLYGRPLRVTVVGHADEIASAASVLMGQGSEARPVILVRGVASRAPHQSAAALIRPPQQDLFR